MNLKLNQPFIHLLQLCVENQCSDLHAACDSMVFGRRDGHIVLLEKQCENPLEDTLREILPAKAYSELERGICVDAACTWEGDRFRINFYRERSGLALALRRLKPHIPTPVELNLPQSLLTITQNSHGLVLVTGPTGSGKSTTLASLINHINKQRACHIVTIEDPVEYVHANHKAIVHQREVGSDTPSFATALREAMRQDPDVILVGEIRDLDTARAALTAAETGHLVFSTLHCGDCTGALDRILALYPPEEQDSARRQLAQTLRAVIAQTLLPRVDQLGRLPAVEVMLASSAVQNLIRTGQFAQLYTTIETGSSQGMIAFESSLAALAASQRVDPAIARSLARNPRLFDQLAQRQARPQTLFPS